MAFWSGWWFRILYRPESGRFGKIAEISECNSNNLTGVDIADMNNNGYAEIFVTSFNAKRTMVYSFVLKYDGTNFNKTIDGSYWI